MVTIKIQDYCVAVTNKSKVNLKAIVVLYEKQQKPLLQFVTLK